ncbi:MAG: hypothetical protein ACI8T1_001086 [Verrucomicrobiales bacterium]|jgi:hypothetical protein
MSIIAILATAGLSIGGAATRTARTARKAQAHNDCLLLQNSLANYHTLEMPFPKAWDGGQLTKGAFLSALLRER